MSFYHAPNFLVNLQSETLESNSLKTNFFTKGPSSDDIIINNPFCCNGSLSTQRGLLQTLTLENIKPHRLPFSLLLEGVTNAGKSKPHTIFCYFVISWLDFTRVIGTRFCSDGFKRMATAKQIPFLCVVKSIGVCTYTCSHLI